MSVVETTKFNMPLGQAELFNRPVSPLASTALATTIGGKTTKSGKISVPAAKKVKPVKKAKVAKEVTDKPVNTKQMKNVADVRPGVVEIGPTIPISPGSMPRSSVKGPNGKFTSNPAYGKWKEKARKFNVGIESQSILQPHKETLPDGSPNFPPLPKVTVPGAAQRAHGYELPKGNTRTANKTRRGMINRMHREAIKENDMRNRNLSRRQKFPS
jgi:hypothetical protein